MAWRYAVSVTAKTSPNPYDTILVSIAGPRGGSIANEEISLSEARSLRDQLDAVLNLPFRGKD